MQPPSREDRMNHFFCHLLRNQLPRRTTKPVLAQGSARALLTPRLCDHFSATCCRIHDKKPSTRPLLLTPCIRTAADASRHAGDTEGIPHTHSYCIIFAPIVPCGHKAERTEMHQSTTSCRIHDKGQSTKCSTEGTPVPTHTRSYCIICPPIVPCSHQAERTG